MIEVFKMVTHNTKERMMVYVRCYGDMYVYVRRLLVSKSMNDEQVMKYSRLRYLDCKRNGKISDAHCISKLDIVHITRLVAAN